MATQPERIATLEQDKRWHWVALTVAVVAAVAWLTYLMVILNGAVGDLRAVKQSIHDGGLGTIVSQIQTPSSPQQLNAALNFVASRIEVQRINKVKPD